MSLRRKLELNAIGRAQLDAELFSEESSESEDEDDISPQPAQSPSFVLDATPSSSRGIANRCPKVSNDGSGQLEDGEIMCEDLPKGTLSLKTSTQSGRRGNVSEDDCLSMSLDEICHQRNITAPPKAPRRHQHGSHSITGAWGKAYKADPRNVSLEEYIQLTNPTERERERQRFVDNAARKDHQNGKCKKGVDTLTESHAELKTLKPSDEVPEWSPDPWYCVTTSLTNKGYGIYWKLTKRKNSVEGKESREYRVLVSYKHVTGICEAGLKLQAMHGAAVDFLQKLEKAFPLISMGNNFPAKVDDGLLLEEGLVGRLNAALKDKHGNSYKLKCKEEQVKVGSHNLWKCTLLIEPSSSVFEGVSYKGPDMAKRIAAKAAMEKLLGQSCQFMPLHMGLEECSDDDTLFKGVESEMMHSYDFSRLTVVDRETVRTSMAEAKAAGKKGNPFRKHKHFKGCIQVSFDTPREDDDDDDDDNGNL